MKAVKKSSTPASSRPQALCQLHTAPSCPAGLVINLWWEPALWTGALCQRAITNWSLTRNNSKNIIGNRGSNIINNKLVVSYWLKKTTSQIMKRATLSMPKESRSWAREKQPSNIGGGICWDLRREHSPWLRGRDQMPLAGWKASYKRKKFWFGEAIVMGLCSHEVSVGLPGLQACHLALLPALRALMVPSMLPASGAPPLPDCLPQDPRLLRDLQILCFFLRNFRVFPLWHLNRALLHVSSAWLLTIPG